MELGKTPFYDCWQIVLASALPTVKYKSEGGVDVGFACYPRDMGARRSFPFPRQSVLTCNFSNSQAVADIIRTTLGPRSMLKMILDASGGE